VNTICCVPTLAAEGTRNITAASVLKFVLKAMGTLPLSRTADWILRKPLPVKVITVLPAAESGVIVLIVGVICTSFVQDIVNIIAASKQIRIFRVKILKI